MKRLISAVVASAMLACTLPAAVAADIDNHWAREYLTEMHELGVINPSASTGNYTPDQPIQRWEFMRYINRAFNFTEKASISFSDVSSSDSYYETVQIAVEHGYINGVGNNQMDPEGTLTREQAATILGRLHKYTPTADLSELDAFSDKASLSNYSKSYVAEAAAQGYIEGYTDGTFKPKGSITRGEIARILYYFLGTSLDDSGGSYTQSSLDSDRQNVTISAPCTLSDATVEGNLYITEGVLAGNVTLENVTVEGDIIVSGGSVTLDGVSALNMVVSNPIGLTPQVTATGNTNIGTTEVQTSAALTESSLGASAGGFSDLVLNGEDISLTLDAAVWDVTTEGSCSILTTGSTSISELTANGTTDITGGGSVQDAILNVSGCELVMQPSTVELASGVTAVIAGESVASSNSVTISPSVLSIDASNHDAIAHSYEFTFNADKDDLVSITVDGDRLQEGTDYNILSDKNGIRLYKTYLTTLREGTYTAELLFEDDSTAAIGIIVGNAAQGTVSPSQVTFDKYDGSVNYSDLTITVLLPTGSLLDSVQIGSTVLERNVDYEYDSSSGAVTIMREALEDRSRGTYTISFKPSSGRTLTCSLTVVDTSPVNEVLPSEIDFDSNTSSGGYQDITVTLSPVEDAELEYIRSGDTRLEEDWQYRISGNEVTINKTALASLGENGASYADLTFVMSSGQNPVLRVNYVTTYALTADVTDDLGLPIEDATVTFTPAGEDTETSTATQTAYTDEDGRATVYVKRGTYRITASHEQFTEDVTETVSISGSRTVKLTGEILETVQLVVTNEYGAPLSGAVVSIGGKSVTTGTDGVASFSLTRGNYVAQVACTGYSTQAVQLTVTDTVRQRVELEATD